MTQRIEDFRSDLSDQEVVEGRAGFARSGATLAYLAYLPLFLHFRQLTEFVLGRRAMSPGEPELGGWVVMRSLADPHTTTVSPNVDTLYGATYLMLDRHGPVVLSTPEITDRYWSVAVLDAYFDNIAVVGSSSSGARAAHHLIVAPGQAERVVVPEGIDGVIEATTNALCLIQRIYTRDPSEYELLHALQDSIELTPLARWSTGGRGMDAVDVDDLAVRDVRATADVMEYFDHCLRYAATNPPSGSASGLVRIFEEVGLAPGGEVSIDRLERTILAGGARAAQRAIDAAITAAPTRGGWRLPDPAAGIAGGSVLRKAATQMTQMGLLPVHEASYFFGYQDAEGRLLDGAHRYELRFPPGALPPVRSNGFWSITMYDQRSLLVDNPIGRYVVRPDTDGVAADGDGTVVVRLQHDEPTADEPGVWLPAPAGAFNVALRIYLAGTDVVDGAWFPPVITRQR